MLGWRYNATNSRRRDLCVLLNRQAQRRHKKTPQTVDNVSIRFLVTSRRSKCMHDRILLTCVNCGTPIFQNIETYKMFIRTMSGHARATPELRKQYACWFYGDFIHNLPCLSSMNNLLLSSSVLCLPVIIFLACVCCVLLYVSMIIWNLLGKSQVHLISLFQTNRATAFSA